MRLLYEAVENLLLVLFGLFATDPACLAKIEAEEELESASTSRDYSSVMIVWLCVCTPKVGTLCAFQNQ